MSALAVSYSPPAPEVGNFSDVPLNDGAADIPQNLDGGNVPGPADGGKTLTQPHPDGFTVEVVGQSLGGDAPATDEYAAVSDYTPTFPAAELDVYTGNWVVSDDPESGVSGVGGSYESRLGDLLAEAGVGPINLAPLDVGGSSSAYWVQGGADFRKLQLGDRDLSDANLVPDVILYNQGEADVTLGGAQWLANFESFVGYEREHGVTAPIVLNINSQPGGQPTGDPTVDAEEQSLAAAQWLAATSLVSQGVYLGAIYDDTSPALWSPDGHQTPAGFDYFAAQWAASITTIGTTATATADGVAARDPVGQLALGVISGDTLTPVSLPTNFNTGWRLVGVTDGDDLLFQNTTTSQVDVQLVTNDQAAGGGALTNQLGPGWDVVAVGDFSGDGHADLVYQKADGGTPVIQFQDGQTSLGGGYVSAYTFPDDWQVVGTVQANSPDETDLVLKSATSTQYAVQFQDGQTELGGGDLSTPWDSTWQLVGAGDFCGDGRDDDLVFSQSTTGMVEVQFLDGIQAAGGGVLQGSPFDDNWRAVAVQGDQITFQNQADRALEYITLSGTQVTGGGAYYSLSSGSPTTDALLGITAAQYGV